MNRLLLPLPDGAPLRGMSDVVLLALRSTAPLALAALVSSCGARSSLEGGSDTTGEGGAGGGVSTRCGNGVVEGREVCDDGNRDDQDACRNTCVAARCGDGVVATFEACDDGNTVSGDGCQANCSLPTCGDGTVDPGEQCDSPDPSVCTPLCLLPACGDGFVAPLRETCDAGPANEDRPALQLIQGELRRRVVPVFSPNDAVSFYDYFSASAHTGFEQAQASRLFFHLQTGVDVLHLFTLHGIDLDTTGISQGQGAIDQLFAGLPPGAGVVFADDRTEELFDAGSLVVRGTWEYRDNTDGGVIGTLPYPGEWVISVDTDAKVGVASLGFIDGGANVIDLDRTETVFLVAHATSSSCRTDCTAPRCGDLIVDGGEVCDDGNNLSGDGCAADCRSTR